MKKTILYNIHLDLGAKIAPFGGYEMPIQYTGVKNEHLAVRNSVGVFDVSHMGEFTVEGPSSLKLLQKICSNDIEKIKIGKAQYNCLPNENGGIIDDLIIYRVKEFKYFLVVNASNIEKDWKWITKWNKQFKAKINNISNQISLLAIQGPKAIEVVQNLTESDLNSLPYYSHVTTSFAGKKDVLVATTGYTGSGGVEVYCKNEDAIEIWKLIFKAGQKFNIIPVGLAARDTLRTEMGYCLYGNEINDQTSPISAGLGWITKPSSGCINNKQFENEILNGTDKKIIGLKVSERGIPRSGYKIFNNKNIEIGFISSGTHSPSLKIGIGLGFVNSEYSSIGTELYIEIRSKKVKASIVNLPFFK
tara:strand:- start:252 stop:1334 length:1083 start_codon:yes stop_codon:yes gene_type:complete